MITTDELVSKIKADVPRVRVQSPALGIDTERFVVEGDVGLHDTTVQSYAARRIEIAQAQGDGGSADDQQGLLGIERNGKTLRWRPGRVLTYAVWRPSYGSDAEYDAVVDCMASATADWQEICGVEFQHIVAKDSDQGLQLGDVAFPVLRQQGGGTTIAMAFFPDDPINDRLVWAFDGFFDPDSSFDPIGVMRHELGHVLGFRHEHIRPETPELFAPESLEHTVEITEYDPKSVMHYLGENVGDPQLRFTAADRTGARQVYGGPNAEFSFAD